MFGCVFGMAAGDLSMLWLVAVDHSFPGWLENTHTLETTLGWVFSTQVGRHGACLHRSWLPW